ncbi:hypothetical protein PybrP1_006659 [[Pythium] brassicae (nom. inval.)]|nr:hypothetical protein PybrP1_006659 [[Pythium] brassicae (nom. inval.)]
MEEELPLKQTLEREQRDAQEQTPEQHSCRPDTAEEDINERLAERLARCHSQSAGTELDLSNLALRDLPLEALAQFPLLKKLNARGNQLTQLPDEIARQLPHLTLLNAADNALTALPDSIGALRSLQRLLLENNRLSRLPAALSKLSALEELNVRANQLEALDDDLGDHLPKLTTLLLGGNERLRSVPRSFGNLLALRTVDLTGNSALELVPDKIRRLHERHVILHSRAKRRELISRALRVRSVVAQSLSASVL